MEHQFLYTPASVMMCTMEDPKSTELMHRLLVPVIPAGVKLQLSTASSTVDDDDPTSDTYRDLRHDIMLLAHAGHTPHLSVEGSITAAVHMGWWDGMEEKMRKFIRSCPECINKLRDMQRIGLSLTAPYRFANIIIDKLKFSNKLESIVGKPGMLLMTCSQIGDEQFSICNDMTATDCAYQLFTVMLPNYGVPYQITSDAEPAFAAEVTQKFLEYLGVKNYDLGDGRPQHHGPIERRVLEYKRGIAQDFQEGLVFDERSLTVTLTKTLVKNTMVHTTHGTTAFQRRTGAVPRIHRQLVSAPSIPETPANTNPYSRELMRALTRAVTDRHVRLAY